MPQLLHWVVWGISLESNRIFRPDGSIAAIEGSRLGSIGRTGHSRDPHSPL